MHRNRHISSIRRVTLPIGIRGCGRGLRMQAGPVHPLNTHIAFNCIVGTSLGLKESKSIEIGIYQASPGSPMLIGIKGRGRGAENAGGRRAPF